MDGSEQTINCQQAQEQLLALEDLACTKLPPELAAHLAACDQCHAMYAKLQRLDEAMRELSAAPGAQLARERFIRQYNLPPKLPAAAPSRKTPVAPAWFMRFRSHALRNLAIAASLLICLGVILSLVNSERSANASEPLVDQLVQWNANLAEAQTPEEREKIFNDHAAQFDKEIARQTLTSEDRLLAQKLAQNGRILKQNNDPIAAAEHLEDINELLLQRIASAAPKGENRAAKRFDQNYARLANRLHHKLKHAQHVFGNSPEKLRQLERIARDDAQQQERLLAIFKKYPNASQKDILRELDKAQ